MLATFKRWNMDEKQQPSLNSISRKCSADRGFVSKLHWAAIPSPYAEDFSKGVEYERQSMTGVAAERECEELRKGFLQVHWQQKEGKGKCGPAAELGDCPGDKERAKIFKGPFTLVFTGKKTCTSPKLLCVAGSRLFGEGGLPTVDEDEAEAHWIKLVIYKSWTRWHAFECWGSWSVLLCVHSLWDLKGI